MHMFLRMIGAARVALACFQPRSGSHFQSWGVCDELAIKLGPTWFWGVWLGVGVQLSWVWIQLGELGESNN